MRYAKVLLVCPKFYKGRNRLAHFPLIGLGYIAEALTKAGVNVEVIDMNLGYELKDLEARIKKYRPELIGFTGMTLDYKKLYQLITKAKSYFPSAKIALGGAHLSSVREKVLSDCPAVDYGIILEGDISMPALCAGEDLKKIQGIIYREAGQVITNKFEHFIDNLDSLQFPRFKNFELDKYPLKQICIVTSRGCPYECIYCSVSASIGRNFRARSAQNIVNEITYWYEKGVRDIFILDDNFTLIYKRVEEFCELMGKKNFKGLRLKNPAGIRADRVDRKLLQALKDIGFEMLAFGVESGSDRILKNIKKGENSAEIEKSIKEACELGFDIDLFFLVGSPGETMEDLNKSFSLAQRYPVRRAVFYNLIPLPSTSLLNWLTEKKYLTHSIEDILNNASYYKNNPCFYTPEMSVADRQRAFKMAQKVSLSVRRKFIERKIKGPLLLRRMLSGVYSTPFAEDVVNNSRFVLSFKEKIKKLMVK